MLMTVLIARLMHIHVHIFICKSRDVTVRLPVLVDFGALQSPLSLELWHDDGRRVLTVEVPQRVLVQRLLVAAADQPVTATRHQCSGFA